MTRWYCGLDPDDSHHPVNVDRSELLPCIKMRKMASESSVERKELHKVFTEYRKNYKGKPQGAFAKDWFCSIGRSQCCMAMSLEPRCRRVASARYWREKMALAWCNSGHHSAAVDDTEMCKAQKMGNKYHESAWKDEL